MDQEAIYARGIGLLVSQRDLDKEQVLSIELTAYPPTMLHADGQMQVRRGKDKLKMFDIVYQQASWLLFQLVFGHATGHLI